MAENSGEIGNASAEAHDAKSAQEQESAFEKQARALYDKFHLTNVTPNRDRAITRARSIVEEYHLPETFYQDEIDLALLLGCAEKLTRNLHPYYQKRIELFLQRLIYPAVPAGLIDAEKLWGLEPDRGGLNIEEVKKYVAQKTDPEATREFKEKHAEEIAVCQQVWQNRGMELKMDIHIVGDNYANFVQTTRAAGYINVPDGVQALKSGSKVTVEVILLKGHSADQEAMVRHELYHIQDYGYNWRRGYQNGILESVDELYTEYMVGNYTERSRLDPHGSENAHYYTAKLFWDQLCYNSGLDFNFLGDRQRLVKNIIQDFGFAGFVDFALMYAHSAGKITTFETFYPLPERPLMEMLVNREKLSLLRSQNQGLFELAAGLTQDLDTLQKYMGPPNDSWWTQYYSVYELIPSAGGKVFSAFGDESRFGTHEVDNPQARRVVTAYARALALMELINENAVVLSEVASATLSEQLGRIPYKRKEVDFDPAAYIQKALENRGASFNTDDEFYQYKINQLFHELEYHLRGIDFAFCLSNPKSRDQILDAFFPQLDSSVQYCLNAENPNFPKWFIDGFYHYVMSWELREASLDYLAEKFPQLKPVIEQKRASFDSRKLHNRG